MIKQLLSTLLILSLSLLLFSCFNQESTEKGSASESISSPSASENTAVGTETPSKIEEPSPSESPSESCTENLTDGQTEAPTENLTEKETEAMTEEPTVPHEHAYGEWHVISEATCKREGKKERVCSCGDKETEMIGTVGHHYVNDLCTMCKERDPNAFVPDYEASEKNLVGTDSAVSRYTAQGGYLYYSSENKIQKIKKSTNTVSLVYKVSQGNVSNVNVIGDWIYFYCRASTVEKSYIAKVRTDGSGFEKLTASLSVYEMLVVKDTVYYTTITEAWTYKDYEKDIFPLYSLSTNGGTPKQLHDGAVMDLVSDGTYLYFSHVTEEGKETICRIKYGSTKSSVLLQNTETLGLSLENSKLYFFVPDKYDPYVSTLVSISTNGGNYTTYANVSYEHVSFHMIGNKAYYFGSLPIKEEDSWPEAYGLIEYDVSTGTAKVLRSDADPYGFTAVFDTLVFESYDDAFERLRYIEIYHSKTNSFKKIQLS